MDASLAASVGMIDAMNVEAIGEQVPMRGSSANKVDPGSTHSFAKINAFRFS